MPLISKTTFKYLCFFFDNQELIVIQFLLVGRTEGARVSKVQLNSRLEECSFTSDVSAGVGALP